MQWNKLRSKIYWGIRTRIPYWLYGNTHSLFYLERKKKKSWRVYLTTNDNWIPGRLRIEAGINFGFFLFSMMFTVPWKSRKEGVLEDG